MNVFNKVLENEYADDTKLGLPSVDEAARLRRINALSAMTGGRGFRVSAVAASKRGQEKRARRAAAMARVSEVREPQFMHSVARRRLAVAEMMKEAA